MDARFISRCVPSPNNFTRGICLCPIRSRFENLECNRFCYDWSILIGYGFFFPRWSSHSFSICKLLCECCDVHLLFDFHIQTKCHAEEEHDSFANRKFQCSFYLSKSHFIPFFFIYISRFNFVFYSFILHMDSCCRSTIADIPKLCLSSALHRVFLCWSYL